MSSGALRLMARRGLAHAPAWEGSAGRVPRVNGAAAVHGCGAFSASGEGRAVSTVGSRATAWLRVGRANGAIAADGAPAWGRFYSGAPAAMVLVPSMGESITEGSIAEILKQPGDAVEVDDVIAQIETDKVTIDIRSKEAGTVESILVKVDDSVTVGQPVATVAPLAAGVASVAAPAAAAAAAAAPAPAGPAHPSLSSSAAAAAALKAPAAARIPSIKFPARVLPTGVRISTLPAAEQLVALAALGGAAAAAATAAVPAAGMVTSRPVAEALVQQLTLAQAPKRRVLLEREIEMINLGGAWD